MPTSLALPYQPIYGFNLQSPRAKAPKRINGIRVNWFVIGSLFGIGLSFFINIVVTQLLIPEYHRLAAEYELGTRLARFELRPFELGTLEPAAGNDAKQMQLASLSSAPPAPQAPTYPLTKTLHVASGDTLLDMLVREQVDYDEAADAISAMRKTYNPRGLRVGQEVILSLDAHPTQEDRATVSGLIIQVNKTEAVQLARLSSGSFSVAKTQKTLSPELTYAGGTINNSLFETGHRHGIPQGVLAELVKAYSYDVDFQREIQSGDQMEVLFERMTTEDGDTAGYGKIFYAKLNIRGRPIRIYRYEHADGSAGFYNEKGESVVKALLRTPVNGARMSSGFGMRRHPILDYSKMHRGTDFAASTGTPIYAAGDGVITFKGRKGGYGNYISIKHNNTYTTAYAHMNGFGRNLHTGSKVKQGQVIGYVGSTGRSTGPHLHYEVHKHGKQVNPMHEKFKTGQTLQGTELANFKRQINTIESQVASMPQPATKIASTQ